MVPLSEFGIVLYIRRGGQDFVHQFAGAVLVTRVVHYTGLQTIGATGFQGLLPTAENLGQGLHDGLAGGIQFQKLGATFEEDLLELRTHVLTTAEEDQGVGLTLHHQILGRTDLGQVPVSVHVFFVVPKDFLADGDGIIQQAGLAVLVGGGKKMLEGLTGVPRLQTQIAKLVDDGRIALLHFQNLLIDRDSQIPVPVFPCLIGFLLQLAKLGQEADPRCQQSACDELPVASEPSPTSLA